MLCDIISREGEDEAVVVKAFFAWLLKEDADDRLTWSARIIIWLFFIFSACLAVLFLVDPIVQYLRMELSVFGAQNQSIPSAMELCVLGGKNQLIPSATELCALGYQNQFISSAVTLAVFGLFAGIGKFIISTDDIKKQAKAVLSQLSNSQYQSILSMLGHEKVATRALGLRQIVQFKKTNPSYAENIDMATSSNLSFVANLKLNDREQITSGERVSLQEADLREANLRWADLRGADLRGAQLQGAKLAGAKLQNAKLGEAYLKDANLVGAQLQGAKLRGARLDKANLSNATYNSETQFPETFDPEGAGMEEV